MFGRRLGVLSFVFVAGGVCILVRLSWVQFVIDDEIRERAVRAGRKVVILPAARGAVRSGDGRLLARDRAAFDLRFVPSTFRERSLLHAVVDAWVLLGDEPIVRGPRSRLDGATSVDELRVRTMQTPPWIVERLLELSASRARRSSEVLRKRGAVLCLADGGDLVRHSNELTYRLRQALGVIRGHGIAFQRKDLLDLRAKRRLSLGEALDVDAAAVAERLVREIRIVAEVGAGVGFATPRETWDRIHALMAAERGWMSRRRMAEICDKACQETFGRANPSPKTIGAERYLEAARHLELPFPDTRGGRLRAWRQLTAAGTIVAGGLPLPALGEDLPDESVAAEVADQIPDDVLARADAAGLRDVSPARFRDAWFERKRRDTDYREEDHITPRRERDLRNRDRGGRDFLFGVGATEGVMNRVVGPGSLRELGFRVTPGFVRDTSVLDTEDAALRRLVGTVSRSERRGVHGIEYALRERLRGQDGRALVDRRGDVEIVRPPVHGQDVALSMSVSLSQRLASLLPKTWPSAIAIVDVRTGGIVGMASSPPERAGRDSAAIRRELETERTVLRRARRRLRELGSNADAWILQQLARGRSATEGSAAEVLERQVLRGVLENGSAWIEPRLDQISVIASREPGWHRAYEPPGQVPPGSVFKVLAVISGLENGVIDATSSFDCIDNKRRRHQGCKNHGTGIGPVRALEQSCNEFCYLVGRKLGSSKLLDLYDRLGLFDPIPGLLAASRAGYRTRLLGNDPANLAIGGGDLSCPPVRAAGIAASLARGQVVHPWLCRKDGFEPIGERFISPAHLEIVHAGMRAVCAGSRGTARGVQGARRLRIAAKTGTADHKAPRIGRLGKVVEAWFVGFAPHDTPRYAFAVVMNAMPMEHRMADNDEIAGRHVAPLAVKALEAVAEMTGERWW